MDGVRGMPVSFQLAWGVRERPTKGPRRGLSLELVIDAGVRVADTDGLGAVSMGRVAKELGTSAMSLYRYVDSKDELLALMVDAALARTKVGRIEGDDGWRAGLERWARAELRAYRENPWALQVPIAGPPLTPNTIAFLERGLRCLAGTPLEPGDKMSVMLTLTSYTRAFAILVMQLDAAFEAGARSVDDTMNQYAGLLRAVTTPADFPALHEVLDAGVFTEEDEDPDYDFTFGLARLLDGFESLITARGA